MNDNHYLISANRLNDGAVVWLGERYEWVDVLDLTCAFGADTVEEAKAAADRAVVGNLVVDPKPREAHVIDGKPCQPHGGVMRPLRWLRPVQGRARCSIVFSRTGSTDYVRPQRA